MTGFGLWQARLNRTTEDYFLASKTIPWVVAMGSIVATETSVLTFVSIPGFAYRDNWFFLQLAFGFIVGRILVSFILLPSFFEKGVQSIYEIIGDRFGSGLQKIASGVFLFTRVLADGVRFLATAVIVQAITGWSITTAVLIIGIITLSYTLLGGLRTIVWLDTFQFFLYLAGAMISIVFILNAMEIGFGQMISDLFSAGKMNILRWGEGNPFMNAWAFPSAFFGGTLLSFASHGSDYMMVQRVLGCRSLQDARKAMIGSGFFVFFQFSLFLLVGSMLFQYLEGIELTKDREFAVFITQHLPIGLKGILLAGVLSAAMSTLSSSINSLASSTMTDWLKKQSLNLAKQVSFGWAIVLVGMAVLFDESDTALVELGLQVASFTYGGLLGLFLLSKFNTKIHPASAIIGLIGSLAIVLYLKTTGIGWTWFIGFAVITNLVLAFLSHFIIKKMNLNKNYHA
jgi:SSS family transporter